MTDKIGTPSGDVGTGSTLLLADTVPLAGSASRKSAAVRTRAISTIGIDIAADQDCTVTVIRLPDGETEGARSPVGSVVAGTPAFFMYSAVLCPAVKIEVTNSSGSAMTSFAMYVRGGA